MCGGNKNKKKAEDAQLKLASDQAAAARERQAVELPFLKSRIEGGLPFGKDALDFQGGRIARSFAPARASLVRRLNRSDSALPSGFREQAMTDFESGRARAFDDSVLQFLLLDEETRARAAGQLNPLGYYGGAGSGYSSVVNAPQQPSLLRSILGGAAQAGINYGTGWLPKPKPR